MRSLRSNYKRRQGRFPPNRLLSTFSTVDHVKNAQSCVNRVNTHRGTYGGIATIVQEVCQEFEVERIQAQPP